jgi:hypothetical protein
MERLFCRPYGTNPVINALYPSSKLLGYYQLFPAEQSFATGRISVPLVLSGEMPNIPEYNFPGKNKESISLNLLAVSLLLRRFPGGKFVL